MRPGWWWWCQSRPLPFSSVYGEGETGKGNKMFPTLIPVLDTLQTHVETPYYLSTILHLLCVVLTCFYAFLIIREMSSIRVVVWGQGS